jgi:hypothetical protein
MIIGGESTVLIIGPTFQIQIKNLDMDSKRCVMISFNHVHIFGAGNN